MVIGLQFQTVSYILLTAVVQSKVLRHLHLHTYIHAYSNHLLVSVHSVVHFVTAFLKGFPVDYTKH